EPALRDAAAAANRYDQPLTLVNVLNVHVGLYGVRITPYFENVLRSEANAALETCLKTVQNEYPAVEASVATHEGRPAHVLADSSRSATLTVVGSRGRGGFAGL